VQAGWISVRVASSSGILRSETSLRNIPEERKSRVVPCLVNASHTQTFSSVEKNAWSSMSSPTSVFSMQCLISPLKNINSLYYI